MASREPFRQVVICCNCDGVDTLGGTPHVCSACGAHRPYFLILNSYEADDLGLLRSET